MSTALSKATALITEFEGCHKRLATGVIAAYPDPIHGWDVATIGWGTTRYPWGAKVKRGDVITQQQANEFLAHVIHQCFNAVKRIPTAIVMTDNQLAALTCFAYNLGAGFYGGRNRESITRLCDSPEKWKDREYVTATFVKYRNPGSSAEKGLRRRREAEAELFLKDV